MRNFFSVLLMVFQGMNMHAQMVEYPETRRGDDQDNFFGMDIPDPYRWLEDDYSEDTKNWVILQNKVTQGYLSNLPSRNPLRDKIYLLSNYNRYGLPFKKGNQYFIYRNDGTQNQSVLYKMNTAEEDGVVLLDPNSWNKEGTSSLGSVSFSKDGKYMAYTVSEAGSDWNQIKVREVNGPEMKDKIEWVKFSSIAFQGEGFYYCSFSQPEKGKELSQKNQGQRLYFHKLGSSTAKDALIYQDKVHPERMFSPEVTKDEKYLIVYISESTSGNSLMIKDLTLPTSVLTDLTATGFEYDYQIVGSKENILYCLTNYKAPRNRLMAIDTKRPQQNLWTEVIPESNDLLEGVTFENDKFIAKYLHDVKSRLLVYDISGKKAGEVELPGPGIVESVSFPEGENRFFFSFTSFTVPSTVYRCALPDLKTTVFKPLKLRFNPNDFETRQEFYTAGDGTKIPIFLTFKKGLIMNSQTPVFLYGYGGFNISVTPSFRADRIPFLERGGVYVVANIRGGGEYGEDWHKAGILERKKQVFEDFIQAAEYLVKSGYTSYNKIAIHGRSNGGLLVGAVMTQRPDICKVAIPSVGVLDMMRYHKFTIGYAWATDYGTSEDPEMAEVLYNYSPYHRVAEGVEYPATLVTTGDHDDRVVPGHSFKFAAALQNVGKKGTNPLLIRIDTNAGHGAGKPLTKQVEEFADIWAFVFHHLGMQF